MMVLADQFLSLACGSFGPSPSQKRSSRVSTIESSTRLVTRFDYFERCRLKLVLDLDLLIREDFLESVPHVI
jgi:hypothetical protein